VQSLEGVQEYDLIRITNIYSEVWFGKKLRILNRFSQPSFDYIASYFTRKTSSLHHKTNLCNQKTRSVLIFKVLLNFGSMEIKKCKEKRD